MDLYIAILLLRPWEPELARMRWPSIAVTVSFTVIRCSLALEPLRWRIIMQRSIGAKGSEAGVRTIRHPRMYAQDNLALVIMN